MNNAAVLTDALREFGTAKDLARAAGCTVRTAVRYRQGETTPDALTMAKLMGRSHVIADAMLRIAGLDDRSVEMEEARLWGELRRIQEKRFGNAKGSTVGSAALRKMAREAAAANGGGR